MFYALSYSLSLVVVTRPVRVRKQAGFRSAAVAVNPCDKLSSTNANAESETGAAPAKRERRRGRKESEVRLV